MADPFAHTTMTTVTDTVSTMSFGYGSGFAVLVFSPVETKQQKIKRIAKERRLASYNTYNQKSPSVKQIKQVCKPTHRLIKS